MKNKKIIAICIMLVLSSTMFLSGCTEKTEIDKGDSVVDVPLEIYMNASRANNTKIYIYDRNSTLIFSGDCNNETLLNISLNLKMTFRQFIFIMTPTFDVTIDVYDVFEQIADQLKNHNVEDEEDAEEVEEDTWGKTISFYDLWGLDGLYNCSIGQINMLKDRVQKMKWYEYKDNRISFPDRHGIPTVSFYLIGCVHDIMEMMLKSSLVNENFELYEYQYEIKSNITRSWYRINRLYSRTIKYGEYGEFYQDDILEEIENMIIGVNQIYESNLYL